MVYIVLFMGFGTVMYNSQIIRGCKYQLDSTNTLIH